MRKSIVITHGELSVKVSRSTRAKRIRAGVSNDGTVSATHPWHVPLNHLIAFIEQKTPWIQERLGSYQHKRLLIDTVHQLPVQKALKVQAYAIVHERVAHFNQFYHFHYDTIRIKNQKTRWGSCSSNKNLNFNYRIALLPSELQNYLIVHELCHLKELNHSKRFWSLVAQQIPDYKDLHRKLRCVVIPIGCL